MKRRLAAFGLALGLFACLPARAAAQDKYAGTQAVAPVKQPSMTAELVDAERKALKKSATVSVHVSGIELVDPASVKEKAADGQGHLHYRVDEGPVIATTATKLSFHELGTGPHTITVVLAGNDHAPLGPSVTLHVAVP